MRGLSFTIVPRLLGHEPMSGGQQISGCAEGARSPLSPVLKLRRSKLLWANQPIPALQLHSIFSPVARVV